MNQHKKGKKILPACSSELTKQLRHKAQKREQSTFRPIKWKVGPETNKSFFDDESGMKEVLNQGW